MSDATDRQRLARLENLSIGVSFVVLIAAGAYQKAILAAVPVILPLWLNLIERRRLDRKLQQEIVIMLSQAETNVAQIDKKLSGEIEQLQASIISLNDRLNQQSLLENISQMQQQQLALEQITGELSSKIEQLQDRQSRQQEQFQVESLMIQAQVRGVAAEFRLVIELAKKYNLRLNPWQTNTISPTPQLVVTTLDNPSQCLFMISAQPTSYGNVKLWLSSAAIADNYPVTKQQVTDVLGIDGWREINYSQLEAFVTSLDQLLAVG